MQLLVRKYPRRFGLGCFVLGAGLFYLAMLDPIWEAQSHAERVSVSVEGGFVGLAGLTLGLAYLIFGVRAAQWLAPDPGKSKVPIILVVTIVVAVAVVAELEIKLYLKNLGYHFGA